MRIRYTIAACLGVLLTSAPLTASTLRTVVLSTDVMPGSTSGQKFNYFAPPVINDLGKTAFFSGSPSSSLDFPVGYRVWSEASGALALVASAGDSVPGLPAGVVLDFFNQIGLNNAGDMAFRVHLEGIGSNTSSIFATFLKTSSGLHFISKTEDPAPGVAGATFGPLELLLLNESSEIAFQVDLNTNQSTLDSIWKAQVGELDLVARTGAVIPGTTFQVNSLRNPTFNDLGDMAISASGLVWVGQPGNLRLVGSGIDPTINSGGHVAFRGLGPDKILTDRTGTVSTLVRNGDPAPGNPGSTFFQLAGMLMTPVLNDSDHIAFRGTLRNIDGSITVSSNTGIWSDVSGKLQLVAREGDPAPGILDDSVFGEFEDNSFVLNAHGQIAFLGRLTGPNISVENDFGIWATDQRGVLHLIARKGDLLEASPGSFRTVRELVFFTGTGNADGRRSGFNDLGQLAFVARFTDRTEGIFVSSLVQIPEPSTYVLLLIAIFIAAATRRRAAIGC